MRSSTLLQPDREPSPSLNQLRRYRAKIVQPKGGDAYITTEPKQTTYGPMFGCRCGSRARSRLLLCAAGDHRRCSASLMSAEDIAVPTIRPMPMFYGRAILVDFAPSIQNARIIHAGIRGLVKGLVAERVSVEELVDAIPSFVAAYGLTPGLSGRRPR